MKTEADSRRLAESLVSIGNASGVKTEALITRMDAPLGRAVGNALEVIECLDVLKGRGPTDLVDVCVELTARMLVFGRVADDVADGKERARRALASGLGLERFRQIVEQQGGDPRIVDDDRLLPTAPACHTITAVRSGFLTSLDAELVGRASVALGAGRDRVEDSVDPAVGIMVIAAPRGRAAGRRSGVGAALPRHRPTRRRDRAGDAGDSDGRPAPRGITAYRRGGSLMADEREMRAGARRSSTTDLAIVAGAIGLAVVAALAARLGVPQAQPLVGAVVVLGIAYAFSIDRSPRDRFANGDLGIGPAGGLRADRAQDGRRPAGVRDARQLDHPAPGLRLRGVVVRLRPVGRQRTMADSGEGARTGRVELARGLPRGADDHLRGRALRHPVLLRHHADRRSCVRRGDASRDARQRRRVAERGRQHLHGARRRRR